MEFTSLLFFKTKEKGNELLYLGPWKFWFLQLEVPGGYRQNRGPTTAGFPACLLAGGKGDVGEKGEGVEAHLWVVSGLGEVLGGSGSTEQGGRRWWSSTAAALR